MPVAGVSSRREANTAKGNEMPAGRPGEPSKRRVLVVANETVEGAALRDAVKPPANGEPAAEVLVIAPALNSRLRHWLSDEDEARRGASLRLAASLERLRAAGIEAEGRVGDADPLQAISDALYEFGAQQIVITARRTLTLAYAQPGRGPAALLPARRAGRRRAERGLRARLGDHEEEATSPDCKRRRDPIPPRSECMSSPARELAQRSSGTDEVLLLWHPDTDRIEVSVRDSTTGAGFHIDVAPGSALDAFNHPHAYAARRDNSYRVVRAEPASEHRVAA
jgi:hypothetical protein